VGKYGPNNSEPPEIFSFDKMEGEKASLFFSLSGD
jgi:hypothetical protein